MFNSSAENGVSTPLHTRENHLICRSNNFRTAFSNWLNFFNTRLKLRAISNSTEQLSNNSFQRILFCGWLLSKHQPAYKLTLHTRSNLEYRSKHVSIAKKKVKLSFRRYTVHYRFLKRRKGLSMELTCTAFTDTQPPQVTNCTCTNKDASVLYPCSQQLSAGCVPWCLKNHPC